MDVSDIATIISRVATMGGDPVSEILAPSEIREIAETLVASGAIAARIGATPGYPPHLAWMATVPPHMHDCFAS